mgnify:FL=1
MTALSSTALTGLLDDLAENGWAIVRQALPADLTLELAQECRQRSNIGVLQPAGVGHGSGHGVQESVRGDYIQWLEPNQSAACDRYLDMLEDLRNQLNRAFYLGLVDYEGHFALYPPGAFYQRHLDRFRDDDRRAVSAVFYLNADWLLEQGGALRLYLLDGRELDIAPEAGTLVVFLSAELPHGVLPANRDRLSLTSWLRRRGDALF